ncbi:MAG: Crp/Fnr family transcriptional regulator [Pirellulales bacterium]
MSERLWYLKRCSLFERISADELARLEQVSRWRKFPRGSMIYFPENAADTAFVLATGRVKLCDLSVDGKESILAFIEPGEMFGELAVLDQSPQDEFATAVEASSVVAIPGDVLRRMIESMPSVSLGITKLIGMRRRRIERRLKSLLFRSNRQRLAHLLLDLVEQHGRPAADGVEIGVKLSHQDLAGVIGSTRESVTLLLGEFQNEGIVRLGRQKIVVLDDEPLRTEIGLPTKIKASSAEPVAEENKGDTPWRPRYPVARKRS